MRSNIAKFFNLQRQIFGICPRSGEFFRLSDCKIYLKAKPTHDWMDKLDSEAQRLDGIQERIENIKEELKEEAREKGRREADKVVRKIDRIFTPRKLNPDDANVIFHPIDYVVFNGMKHRNTMKNIIFLTRESEAVGDRRVTRSIEKVIEQGDYEWLTLRVQEDGTIREED